MWAVCLLSVFLGAVVQYGRETAFRDNYISRIANEQSVRVYGQIYKKECKNNFYRYYLKRCSIYLYDDTIPCNSIIAYFESDDFSIGDILMLDGKVKMFETATNEGQFDAKSFYYSQKIDFSLLDCKVRNIYHTKILLWEWLQDLREQLIIVLRQQLDEEQAGVMASMLYGEKALIDSEVKELYQSSGISHILAISGLHVSVIGMAVYGFLKRRIGFTGSAIVAGGWILLYGQMTGWAISAQRAIGMMFLVMGAYIFGRTNDLLNSLGGMVLFLLVQNPFLLQYMGFDFSVIAICGVGITGAIFSLEDLECQKEEGDTVWENVVFVMKHAVYSVRSSLWISIGIFLTTLPLVAVSYYEIPTYSLVLNMLILPILSLVLTLGILGSVVGLKYGVLSYFLFRPVNIFLQLIQMACKIVERFPNANRIVGKPSYDKIVLYYIIMGILLEVIFIVKEKKGTTNQSVFVVKSLTCMVLVGIIFVQGFKPNEIDILDVGQGDGIYISAKDGTTYFIDGGSTSVKDVGKYRILPFLKSKKAMNIDYWFVSHADDDHISGLLEVMESGYKIRNLVLSRYMIKDEAFEVLTDRAKESGITILFMDGGEHIVSRDVRIKCLYPNREISEDRNDMSLVLEVAIGKFHGIFAGDISSELEKQMVEEGLLEDVDFYKVNHHGSKYSSCKEYLEKIRPEVTVISCAKRNRYGHPAEETVERIQRCGSEIYYTMNSGQISITEKGIQLYLK